MSKATSGEAHAPTYNLINLQTPFKLFVNKYRSESFERQWVGWNEFRVKHSAVMPPITCTDCEEKSKRNVKEFFSLLPSFESSMWQLFSESDEIITSQIKRFKSVFSDLPDGVTIAFVPSMFGFNGQVRTVNDKPVLFIGVDFVALRKDDLNVLFSHEFFHVYQGITLSRLGKNDLRTMAVPLWFEGLATWMSIELNLGTSDAVALMDETLALAKFCEVKENVQTAAREFLKIIDYATDGTDATYADWFKLIGPTQPKRRGYCLGLQVLRRLSKNYEVQDLVQLGEEEFSALIKKTLSEF